MQTQLIRHNGPRLQVTVAQRRPAQPPTPQRYQAAQQAFVNLCVPAQNAEVGTHVFLQGNREVGQLRERTESAAASNIRREAETRRRLNVSTIGRQGFERSRQDVMTSTSTTNTRPIVPDEEVEEFEPYFDTSSDDELNDDSAEDSIVEVTHFLYVSGFGVSCSLQLQVPLQKKGRTVVSVKKKRL